MRLEQVLEMYEVSPARSIELMAKKLRQKRNKSDASSWARNEIVGYLNNVRAGSGQTVHNKMNDIAAMISALNLYTDEDVDERTRRFAKKSYEKVINTIRAKSST